MLTPLIVLAEDNHELRALLASALENVGYAVLQVETGNELVDLVQRMIDEGAPPRLIITDVRMPNMDGLAAARILRARGDIPPLIFMTAYGDSWSHAQAGELGAVLLEKPLSIETLRQAVRRAIPP